MKWICFFGFLFICIDGASQSSEITLHSNWKFRRLGDKQWLKANVPGTVHTDLLSNNKIPDPFWGTNEKSVQWVDSADWEYECVFDYHPKAKEIYLQLEGLDTYAEVSLNGKSLLATNNMFRTWQVRCEAALKEGENRLTIIFRSAVIKGNEEVKKLPYKLPGEERVFTRKAAYHYGWDWGPRFVTCGIWKPVKLIEVHGSLRVLHHEVMQDQISNNEALLRILTQYRARQASEIHFSVFNNKTNELIGSSITKAQAADSIFETKVVLKNPKLWWCNGMGEPYLYNLRFEIEVKESKEKIIQYAKIGIRKIELVQETDSIGKSFYFKINGKPVFAKGANVIPADNFLPRVNPEYYKNLVKQARESNMNMLRVWGGGVYPNDAFYDACDEAGIIVWQDFMFANTAHPGTAEFVNNVKAEVKDQVIRLRHHPSLALWCGNNEISEGWFNWGWQKQYNYSKKDSAKIWNDYQTLFEKEIPSVVNAFDPAHNYWPSSPKNGWGRKKSLYEGDLHYWGVWWGLEPFSKYNEKVGRFVSEYGFQGMPSSHLFEKISNEKNFSLSSEIVKQHQKHPTGFQTIDHYLKQSYKSPKAFADYCYVSQLVQAEGMKIAIEAHRRNQPYCMGTLFWQLNDCWPVTSWSSIDYNNVPKASYYFIKKAFKNKMVSIVKEGPAYKIFLINDSGNDNLNLSVSLQDFSGNNKRNEIQKITSQKGSQVVYSIDSVSWLKNLDLTRLALVVTVRSVKNEIAAQNIFYFTEPKNIPLEKPTISVIANNKNSFIISTDKLAKNVFLDAGYNITFSDNYFDLFPGVVKEIEINSEKSVKDILKEIKIKSLYDTYQ
jgi:beta-mannosidase